MERQLKPATWDEVIAGARVCQETWLPRTWAQYEADGGTGMGHFIYCRQDGSISMRNVERNSTHSELPFYHWEDPDTSVPASEEPSCLTIGMTMREWLEQKHELWTRNQAVNWNHRSIWFQLAGKLRFVEQLLAELGDAE